VEVNGSTDSGKRQAASRPCKIFLVGCRIGLVDSGGRRFVQFTVRTNRSTSMRKLIMRRINDDDPDRALRPFTLALMMIGLSAIQPLAAKNQHVHFLTAGNTRWPNASGDTEILVRICADGFAWLMAFSEASGTRSFGFTPPDLAPRLGPDPASAGAFHDKARHVRTDCGASLTWLSMLVSMGNNCHQSSGADDLFFITCRKPGQPDSCPLR